MHDIVIIVCGSINLWHGRLIIMGQHNVIRPQSLGHILFLLIPHQCTISLIIFEGVLLFPIDKLFSSQISFL